ncbi:MAG: hypothetical protein ACXVZH_17000 [Terriglobales bacterium]
MAAQFVVGLAHVEGYCVEKNGLSAHYWLRLAEASSHELGDRSRALVEQIRSGVEAHELEDVEGRISVAVKKINYSKAGDLMNLSGGAEVLRPYG